MINLEMPKRIGNPDLFSNYDLTKIIWTHDITEEKYSYCSKVSTIHPVYSMCWCDGTVGGYDFECEYGRFQLEEGIRGIGFKAVIAFDFQGNGIVFIK